MSDATRTRRCQDARLHVVVCHSASGFLISSSQFRYSLEIKEMGSKTQAPELMRSQGLVQGVADVLVCAAGEAGRLGEVPLRLMIEILHYP